MSKLNNYIKNPAKYNIALNIILKKAGNLNINRLSLAALLTLHAMIAEVNIEEDQAIFKLLDILHLHILERLAFVPEGQDVGQYLYEQEHVGLTLKHVFYAKKMLLQDFELRLRHEAHQKLNLVYRLIYDRFIGLFVLLSHYCIKGEANIESEIFSMDDLTLALQSNDKTDNIYFNELRERLIVELQNLRFLKKLSTQGVWQGIQTILHLIKEHNRPFGEFRLDKVYH